MGSMGDHGFELVQAQNAFQQLEARTLMGMLLAISIS